MTRSDLQLLREILHGALRRYLTVRPRGFELHPGDRLRPLIDARIISYGSARTLYQQRKPHCRSLDGLRPLSEPNRHCSECQLRSRCTPQVRLDLFVDAQPFRLLLAHTSAKNFLLYEAQLRQRPSALYQRLHRIAVLNRGSWGELRFTLPENGPNTP
jgi:hypothetical protein